MSDLSIFSTTFSILVKVVSSVSIVSLSASVVKRVVEVGGKVCFVLAPTFFLLDQELTRLIILISTKFLLIIT